VHVGGAASGSSNLELADSNHIGTTSIGIMRRCVERGGTALVRTLQYRRSTTVIPMAGTGSLQARLSAAQASPSGNHTGANGTNPTVANSRMACGRPAMLARSKILRFVPPITMLSTGIIYSSGYS
jgi:hypothetical protein